ncbi:mediator of DNA damage checkpoint protein 1 [Lampris incognitus]|uniref:mediator of DNA damage checkpoint protein 1 n=1 Tax=Lampris incognitus TaxID=2546036 RepID=UPI0024B54898|nr:mediator of DNA damage checkpoint protein 1 [Lampris incognitus]
MDATQMIDDSIYESEEEENEDDNEKREPLAKLRILKNEHVPQTELPLYLGENVLGRDPSICTLPLPARSVSKRHTTICISVFRPHGHRDAAVMEALVWDMGSMNGTRKGYIRLSPHVRYALSEGDRLVVADIPCQYVSCAADKISKQEDVRSPVNKHSEKRVNRDSKVPALALSPNQEETKKTAEIKGLSFERTPAQPKGTLVPESDSDSEGEQGTRKDRRLKAVVSDSESHASNPTCSSFLSPTNIIIPESEDESPITPSSSTKNRSKNCVSFSEEEKDMDVGRHQLKKERAQVIVDDSAEEEDGREKEQTAPGEREPEKSGRDVPVKQANAVRLSKEDGLPVSTTAISLDVVPVFKVDNDTDVEGEEEEEERDMSAGPATLNESQTVDHSKYRAQFHMDSDTDVDEDADALNNVNKSVPASYDCPKHTNSLRVVQSTAINLESDTDVDDDDCAAVSGTAARATTTSLQNASTADTAPFTLSKDFHVDSDTDVDEKDDYSGAGNTEHSATMMN